VRAARLSYRAALRSAVGAEAHAYGFTLVVWTTGALALTEEGLVTRRVLGFIGGALLAMILIVIAAFRGVRAAYLDVEHVRLAYGAIHIVSVVAGVAAGLLMLWLLDGVPAVMSSAFVAITLYNLLLAAEVRLSVRPAPGGLPRQEGEVAPPEPDRRGGSPAAER